MRHYGGVGERRRLIERYPLYCTVVDGILHRCGQCVSAPAYQGAAHGQLLVEFGWSSVFALNFTSLIENNSLLVIKVFLDQFRLFFSYQFFCFPRSLAQAMICSTFPSLFDVLSYVVSRSYSSFGLLLV